MRRGSVLLEVVVALAIFTSSAMAVLAALGRGAASVLAARDAQTAVDVARSAMAELEAGLATPEGLLGPVTRWDEIEEEGMFADAPPGESLWWLEVDTEPSPFAGLTMVTVRAVKHRSETSSEVVASYTLRQLVRLSTRDADRAGEEDALMEAARRGARSGGQR